MHSQQRFANSVSKPYRRLKKGVQDISFTVGEIIPWENNMVSVCSLPAILGCIFHNQFKQLTDSTMLVKCTVVVLRTFEYYALLGVVYWEIFLSMLK